MKIKHTLERNGKNISGRIKETIFEEGEYRSDNIRHYTEDGDFYICSCDAPKLNKGDMYVWGGRNERDDNLLSYTYETEERAKQVMARIDEFTIQDEPEFKEGEYVYVRNNETDAWRKRMFLTRLPKGKIYKYITTGGYRDLEEYKKGNDYDIRKRRFIKPYKETITIKTEDGETIEIAKDKAKDLGFKLHD